MSKKERLMKVGKKLLITVVIILSIGLLLYVTNEVANTRIFSEKRAKKNASLFVKEHNIKVKRLTCAGDTVDPKYKVRDGYGSCALVTEENEKIMLQCPADFLENLVGAKSCKEYFITLNLTASNSNAASPATPTE